MRYQVVHSNAIDRILLRNRSAEFKTIVEITEISNGSTRFVLIRQNLGYIKEYPRSRSVQIV